MNRVFKISVTALVVAGLSAPLVADDDKARFESSGFLKSLDAFIVEQMAKQKGGGGAGAAADLKELELSFRDKQSHGDNFFRLSDSRSLEKSSTNGLSARPGFSSLMAPTGTVKGAYGLDATGGNSRFNLSFGKKQNDTAEYRGLEVSFESAYRFTQDGSPTSAAFADSGSMNREYNLGVTLGYSGFGVDATMIRQTNLFEPNLSGFDIGFSYRSKSWAARLSMSGYRAGADLFGIENDVRSIVSVELGASYKLTDKIGFKGGVRYYDYGDQWVVVDPDAGENSQMLFLGGQLKF